MTEEILTQITQKSGDKNELAVLVEEKRWNRRKTLLAPLKPTDIFDFPELTEKELKFFFTGTYQFTQAVSYLAEMIDEDGNIEIQYVKEAPNIVRFEIRSRHINSRTYKSYIKYQPNESGISALEGYCCDCANGLRTIGCCSHVAAAIYYLAHARYLAKIIKLAEMLTKIFETEDTETTINEDSDDD